MEKSQEYIVRTLFGLEDVLGKELEDLGVENIQKLKRAVSFEGDKGLMYRANLHLRTALRVLKPIHRFEARNEHQFYRGIQAVNWSKHMDKNDTFAIDTTVYSDYFTHSKYVMYKAKDAIVDQFRKHFHQRPSVDFDAPTLRIHVHISERDCTVLLDSSGSSLHKRAYRTKTHRAPINEVLAAGMIMLSGWHGERPFCDMMCGAGTIVCEAALIGQNIAAGTYRPQFGFQTWKDYDHTLWRNIQEEAKAAQRPLEHPIVAADIASKTVDMARGNMILPAFEEIRVSRKDFFKNSPKYENGVLMMNPPYGERYHEEDILDFYKKIGDTMKKYYAGYEAWIISSNKQAIKNIGLRPSKKYQLFNGRLECKFHRYDLYKGTKNKSDDEKNNTNT